MKEKPLSFDEELRYNRAVHFFIALLQFLIEEILTVADRRPVFLDIPKMRFPVTALVSISHRLTGVVIFLFLPLLIYLLQQSLASPLSFYHLMHWLAQSWVKGLMWVFLAALSVHFFAGVRHVLMDLGVGEHLGQAKFTAYLVFALSVIAIVLEGVWLW